MSAASFVLGSGNIAKENRHPGVALRALLQHVDVACLQEVQTRRARRRLRVLARDLGFVIVWPSAYLPLRERGGSNSVPIVYRPELFDLLTVQVERTMKGQRGNSPARFVVAAVLRHRGNGHLLPVENTHMIQQAWTTRPGNRPEWLHHAEALNYMTEVMQDGYGRVVGMGDHNKNRWHPANTHAVFTEKPTHGGVWYDVPYFAGDVAIDSTSSVHLPGSDHRGVLAHVVLP